MSVTGELQAAIGRALAASDFAGAQKLWTGYMEELRRAVERGEATAGDIARARDLLATARVSAAALRAHSAARLDEARAALAYVQPEPPAARRTRLL